LRQHATLIKGIETREPLLTEAQNLNLVYEDYLAMAFRTLRALKLARFTSAIDTMQLFHRQLQEAVAVQIRNANERQVRERGLGEVESILSRLEEQLVLVETELDRTQVRRFDNAYEDIVEELSPLYPDLLRAYQLLEELSTGIVL
jgi:hypothetical protein